MEAVAVTLVAASLWTTVWFISIYAQRGLAGVARMIDRWWPTYPMALVLLLAVGPLLDGGADEGGLVIVAVVATLTLLAFAVADRRWLRLTVAQVTVAMAALGCAVVAAQVVAVRP